MLDALEIGRSAQMYVSEGQYKLALEKFESSLGILVPLLATEPSGIRKELLYKQVSDPLLFDLDIVILKYGIHR